MTKNTRDLAANIKTLAQRSGIDPRTLTDRIIHADKVDGHLIPVLREDGSQYDSVQEAMVEDEDSLSAIRGMILASVGILAVYGVILAIGLNWGRLF